MYVMFTYSQYDIPTSEDWYSCFVGSSSYQSKAVTVAKENSFFPLKTFVTFESANPQQIIGMFISSQ